MRIKLIINPNAGIQKRNIDKLKQKIHLGKKNQKEQQIKDFFEKKGIIISVARTKQEKEATKIAKNTRNYDIIIVAGGDGTVNEVINGINNKTKLGIIPLGSENLLAKELEIPLNIKKACELIYKGKTKKVDVGISNKKKFVLMTGIGFDAHAIINVKKQLKQILGRHSYALAGLKTLLQHTPTELRIKIDEKKEVKGYFAIITNVKNYGGNIVIAPKAKLDDGYLELCLFKNKDILSLMKYLVAAASRQLGHIKEVEHYRIKKAEITSKRKVLYHTDAEVGGVTPVKVSILPKKLEIITP